jgi:hypothetical protein
LYDAGNCCTQGGAKVMRQIKKLFIWQAVWPLQYKYTDIYTHDGSSFSPENLASGLKKVSSQCVGEMFSSTSKGVSKNSITQ